MRRSVRLTRVLRRLVSPGPDENPGEEPTPPFSPVDLPGLWAWWDFTDPDVMFTTSTGDTKVASVDDPIGRIEDKSGNSHHAIQATNENRPLYKLAVANNQPAALFDSTDLLACSDTFDTSDSTLFVVARTPAGLDEGTLYGALTAFHTTNGGQRIQKHSTDNQWAMRVSPTNATTRGGPSVEAATVYAVASVVDAAANPTRRLWVDGTQVVTNNTETTAPNVQSVAIGRSGLNSTNDPWTGHIIHAMVFQPALTDEELGDLFDWATAQQIGEPAEAATPPEGIEGYGASTVGGTGGTEIWVTSLADDGEGTLREAINTDGPRIVKFAKGGYIDLESTIDITKPYITIDFESAPVDSGGITIRNAGTLSNAPLRIRCSEVIILGGRIRPGPSTNPTSGLDAITLGVSGQIIQNIVLARGSYMFSVDENMNPWYSTRNLTIQDCIIAWGLDKSNHTDGHAHSKGLIIGSGQNGGRVSVIRCIFAHNKERNPLVTTGAGLPVQLVNCLIYNPNWTIMPKSSYGSSPEVDIVNCELIKGANTSSTRYLVEPRPSDDVSPTPPSIYVSGNRDPVFRPNDTYDEDACVRPAYRHLVVETPHSDLDLVTVMSVADAKAYMLANCGYHTPYFDEWDQRVIDDIQNETGSIIDHPSDLGDWPTLAEGTPP